MKSRNKTAITALVAGLIGLGWFAAAQAIDLQWYGHAAMKITTDNGKVIVIDPFITKNPKTPEALKDLNKLGKVDLILLTHGHGDHVGDSAQGSAIQRKARLPRWRAGGLNHRAGKRMHALSRR